MPHVSSTISCGLSPSPHKVFRGESDLDRERAWRYWLTSFMMMPPKLWPMKMIGTRWQGVSKAVSEVSRFLPDGLTDALLAGRVVYGQSAGQF